MRSAICALLRKCRRGHTQHSSDEQGKTTDETGHTDDGIGDGDAAGLDVVHREDKHGGGDGEETPMEVI
jgi:hypothetical protein